MDYAEYIRERNEKNNFGKLSQVDIRNLFCCLIWLKSGQKCIEN